MRYLFVVFTVMMLALPQVSFAGQGNRPIVPLHTEKRPKASKFITLVQAQGHSMDEACYRMSKKAKEMGGSEVYSVSSTGSSRGFRGTYICYGEAVE